MKVDVVRSFEKHDAFYTLAPLYCILKLIGLNLIYRDGKVLKYNWSPAKVTSLIILLTGIYVFNLYCEFVIWKRTISLSFKDAVEIIFLFGYFRYLLDVYFIYKYGKDITLQYFSVYDRIDKIIGLADYADIRKRVVILIYWLGGVVAINGFFDLTSWYLSFGAATIGSFIIDYIYIILRNLSLAEMIAQVVQILIRLKAMGDTIEIFFLISDAIPRFKDAQAEGHTIRNTLDESKSIRASGLGSEKTVAQYEIMLMEYNRCYLMILEQCDYINTMYGVRILGICFAIFMDMIIVLNIFLRIIMGSFTTSYGYKIFPAISSALRVLAGAAVLFFVSYRCEQAYGQTQRLVSLIDHLLVNKKISPTTRQTLTCFRSLVTSRPVRFHAADFYTIDFPLMLTIASAVLTHTVIMLQNLV